MHHFFEAKIPKKIPPPPSVNRLSAPILNPLQKNRLQATALKTTSSRMNFSGCVGHVTILFGGVARWLGRRSVAGGLSLIYA